MISRIKTSSTSSKTAECHPIILRETKTTRIVFHPVLIDNLSSPDASINGSFLYIEKKGRNESWEEYERVSTRDLKAGEIFPFELHGEELLNLYKSLGLLYNIYEQNGIEYGDHEYLVIDMDKLSQKYDDDDIDLDSEREMEIMGAFNKIFTQIAQYGGNAKILHDSDKYSKIMSVFEGIDIENIKNFNSLIYNYQLKLFSELWESNKTNADENYWQEKFEENPLILSLVFAQPLILIQKKPYMGGKRISNLGGCYSDFLYSNPNSKNIAIIEIKTPVTDLINGSYRNVYSVSSDLSGSINQVLKQREEFLSNWKSLAGDTEMKPINPKCILIIGNNNDNMDKKSSFGAN